MSLFKNTSGNVNFSRNKKVGDAVLYVFAIAYPNTIYGYKKGRAIYGPALRLSIRPF